MGRKTFFFAAVVFMLFLVFANMASAKKMTLLAVSQEGEKLTGSVAELELEIRPGSGRVFLETYPLSKLDTQISTRFAKSVACNHINVDCNNYDFFYSIKSDSVIVGGPSAGSSITMLTIFGLQNIDFDEKTALTGTINSGGLIGPVSGLKEKIDAAKQAGLAKVLIPQGEMMFEESLNSSLTIINGSVSANVSASKINLSEYGAGLGIDVVEVSDINDAMFQFTGKKPLVEKKEIVIDEQYAKTMNELSLLLCNRSKALAAAVNRENNLYKDGAYKSLLNESDKNYETSRAAYARKDYYSSASYCFGVNTNYRFMATMELNLTTEQIITKSQDALAEINSAEKDLNSRKLETLTDLQTYMVVKERLDEARVSLSDAMKYAPLDRTKAVREMTYGIERLYSAYSWAHFFDNTGMKITLNDDALKNSCIEKISEAEERRQYLLLIFPAVADVDLATELSDAYAEMNKSNYKMCLFRASKSKAEIDIVLTAIGVEDTQMRDLIVRKQAIVEDLIAKQQDKAFPILGYSYLEYSRSLIDQDKYAAMLYSEYALELSNLDLYFTEPKTGIAALPNAKTPIVVSYWWLFMFALVVFMAGFMLFYFSIHRKHIKKNKNKHNPERILKKKRKRKLRN